MSNEEKTGNLPGARPFEERVLSAIQEMRTDFNSRLEKLEAKSYDTKPIWERALAEIVETRQEMRTGFRSVERQIGVLSKDITLLRADLVGFEERLTKLEG